MLANWVKQITSTTGTGTITLGTAVDGCISVGTVYSDGDKFIYSIIDGNNREIGYGTYTASGDLLTRTTVLETLVSGVYDNTSPSPINLSGSAIVMVAATNQSLTEHGVVWKDLLAPIATAKLPSVSAPTWTAFQPGGGGNLYQYAFAVGDMVFLTYHVNHDMAQTGLLYPHMHWTTDGTDTGNVQWKFEYSYAKGHNQEAFTNSSSTIITVEEAATGIPYQHMVTEDTVGIPVFEPDTLIICAVSRIAASSDENTDTVFGLSLDAHYPATYVGTPQRAPNFYTW